MDVQSTIELAYVILFYRLSSDGYYKLGEEIRDYIYKIPLIIEGGFLGTLYPTLYPDPCIELNELVEGSINHMPNNTKGMLHRFSDLKNSSPSTSTAFHHIERNEILNAFISFWRSIENEGSDFWFRNKVIIGTA